MKEKTCENVENKKAKEQEDKIPGAEKCKQSEPSRPHATGTGTAQSVCCVKMLSGYSGC